MIRIGTRGSDLALWQANYISQLIGEHRCEIIVIKTKGDIIKNISFDKIEGKGFFTKEIEESLLDNKIDLAIHSMKDLPTSEIPGLTIGAVPPREDPSDLLLLGSSPVDCTMAGKVIGTSSLRRASQFKNKYPESIIKPLRGNVPTRIDKLRQGDYDGIILAKAGINRLRLDLSDLHLVELPCDDFLPAPAQGALAVQLRVGDTTIMDVIKKISCFTTLEEVTAERTFLKEFGGGCQVPIGAYAKKVGDQLILSGLVASPEGEKIIRDKVTGQSPATVGKELALKLKSKGADKLL